MSSSRHRSISDRISQAELDDNQDTTKRAVRKRNKPKKYGDFLEVSPTKRKLQNADTSDDNDDESMEEVDTLRPTALFCGDDVEGQDMFKFKSRHTRHDLQNKVRDVLTNSPRIESPMKTPRKTIYSETKKKISEATPKHVKNIIKKRIVNEVESESDEDGFSGSSSDFVPDDSENEASSVPSSSASEEDEEPGTKIATKVQVAKAHSKTKSKDSEYIITSDNYFMMNSTKKIATSDHTLARLKNLNLDDHLEKESIQVSKEHKNKIIDLNNSYNKLFDKWIYILSENFNIILYGIGSKRSVLHEFQVQKLSDHPCIVVNGFFPSLTMKSILETIIVDLLNSNHVPSNIGDIVKIIETRLAEDDIELFLIIHNIDGTMLQNSKSQTMLASISQINNVHTIATIDHINAPLLWDHSKLSKFRFSWWDVTTFLPYSEETAYENSLMTHRSGALQLSSLKSVYQSLTSNAKGIFNVIIQNQLDNHKQSHYQGLPFKELYSKSREQFLVSSDTALRAQLTEFLDHKLVKIKRTYDGSENLVIPIDNTLLLQFLEQNN